jgi:hypothetical protein
MTHFQTLLSSTSCAAKTGSQGRTFDAALKAAALVLAKVGRCRLPVSKSELTARLLSALESKML